MASAPIAISVPSMQLVHERGPENEDAVTVDVDVIGPVRRVPVTRALPSIEKFLVTSVEEVATLTPPFWSTNMNGVDVPVSEMTNTGFKIPCPADCSIEKSPHGVVVL